MFVVGPSQLENAGEGLFAARHIKRGTLVRLQHTRPMRKSHAHTDTLNFYITADVDDSGPCLCELCREHDRRGAELCM